MDAASAEDIDPIDNNSNKETSSQDPMLCARTRILIE